MHRDPVIPMTRSGWPQTVSVGWHVTTPYLWRWSCAMFPAIPLPVSPSSCWSHCRLFAVVGLMSGMTVPFNKAHSPDIMIERVLVGKTSQAMPEAFFPDRLNPHFSQPESRRQLQTAIDWGRYAELFAYDERSQQLDLG
ncbi:MAG: AAA-associated domain-containing protein [Candidatus Sericytochromatia bacterium]|nr:AAA-associated domain-containing protein [Candidatus Sericytochromatia bacterium]